MKDGRVDADLQDLLLSMMHPNAQKRLSIPEIRQHSYFQRYSMLNQSEVAQKLQSHMAN